MSNEMKPVIVGDYPNGDLFAWAYWLEHHACVAVIGDNECSKKRDFINELARAIATREKHSVYWITPEENGLESDQVTLDAIPWVETFSDPPEIFHDRHTFMETRSFFVSSFVQLLARQRDISRSDLPQVTYREHMEGPLAGFMREVNNQGIEWLEKELNELERVYWERVEGNFRYVVQKGGTLNQKTLSFLKGIWSFWAHTARLEEPQQIVVIVEPPKELLLHSTDPVLRNIVVEALRILTYISEVTTTTVILSSELLYPAPEQNYRYFIFLPTKNSDINLTTPENRERINSSYLFEEWERGNTSLCLWEDRHTSQRHIVQLRTHNMSFVTNYE